MDFRKVLEINKQAVHHAWMCDVMRELDSKPVHALDLSKSDFKSTKRPELCQGNFFISSFKVGKYRGYVAFIMEAIKFKDPDNPKKWVKYDDWTIFYYIKHNGVYVPFYAEWKPDTDNFSMHAMILQGITQIEMHS